MTDPHPGGSERSVFALDAERALSPRMRTLLYLVAGILVALWLVIQLYGAGGFFALVAGVVAARLAYGGRPSLNVAFVAGFAVFLVALLLWGSLLQGRWDEATATPPPFVVTGP